MVAKSHDLQLTERDIAILDHIRAFRMSLPEVVQRLFFEKHDMEAVKSWLRRMRRAGLVGTAPFVKPRKYLYLTPAAVQKLYGEPAKAGGPLTAFPLARQYGMLAFCCLQPTVHRKLTAREFADKFAVLAADTLPKDFYYVDKETQPQRLGYIYVDHGRNAPRIVQRFQHIVRQRFKILVWRTAIIDQDRFAVAIVTSADEKKKRIEEAFSTRRDRVPVKVAVAPDLIHLV